MAGVVDLTLRDDDHSFDPLGSFAVPLEHRSPLFQPSSIESKRFKSVPPVLFHVCRHHSPVYDSNKFKFLKCQLKISIHFSWNERIVRRTFASITGRSLVLVYRGVHLRVCWNIGAFFECSETSTDRQLTGGPADVANRLGSAPWNGY